MLRILIVVVLLLSGISKIIYSQSIPKSLYIVNTLGENLSSINLDNHTVNQNALALGLYTNEVKISGDKGYVINSGLNEIQVFDLNTMTTTSKIQLESSTNPYNMDFINDSLAVISLLITNKLAIVNVYSGQIINSILVGNGPEGVKYYAGKIYVTNTNYNCVGYDPGTVSVIDAVSQTVVNTINVGTNPQSEDIDINGNLIIGCTGNYSNESGRVDVIDISADTLKYSIDFNTSITSVRINSLNKLYIGKFGYGVMVYNLNTRTFERS
ncbi:YncE family protein [Calditrichota bacterium]